MPFVPLREYPTFGRVATWEEWYDATSKSLPDMLWPWFCSNMVGFIILWIAIAPVPNLQQHHHHHLARKIWGLLFIVASIVNIYIILTDPKGYHEFGVLAIPPLQHFIYSKHFENPSFLVIPIAICQNVIGFELLFDDEGDDPPESSKSTSSSKTMPPSITTSWRLKMALVSAMIWFFGITPLGLGSAFPSSLIYATTMMICWPSNHHVEDDDTDNTKRYRDKQTGAAATTTEQKKQFKNKIS